uniref:trypsin n=1 Tax=Cyprinus carpio TaxID=7962 RepID=A0A8C1JJY8_CYPCA
MDIHGYSDAENSPKNNLSSLKLMLMIMNGREAKPHSRPYMVSVQSKKSHICSGFLISDRFVMTAAHCRENFQVLTVVLGAHDLQKNNENSVRFTVESYHQHPDYTMGYYHNNILLLKVTNYIFGLQLEKYVQLNNNFKWISIPAEEGNIEAGSVCSVAGWRSLETNGRSSCHLMETNVKVMNNMECEHGGSCDGDSGGPLVCGDTAVGVTSFGDPDLCNSLKLPEVYTKISMK